MEVLTQKLGAPPVGITCQLLAIKGEHLDPVARSSVHPSVNAYPSESIRASIYLSVHPFVHPSISPSVRPPSVVVHRHP